MSNLHQLLTADNLEAAASGYAILRMVGADLLRLVRPGTGKRRRTRMEREGQPPLEG
ncbi:MULTISPECIES: hypothetical protein [Streptomyces]|uniref:Uncharacterized protein n=1 Tax=Streptomyces griseosporeus TaxID=1910 RepID=A0ABV3KWC1_STRGS|nr:hypothetical protein [Streptomyces actuosus]MBM4824029.1 hypothetical protein [Streptomyces actuosus]